MKFVGISVIGVGGFLNTLVILWTRTSWAGFSFYLIFGDFYVAAFYVFFLIRYAEPYSLTR